MGAMSFVSEDIAIHINMDNTVREIHNLAYFYHWGWAECWNIPCTERGVWNDQIRHQIKVESSNSSNNSGTSNKSSYKESK